ncbi:hypothetical protein [Leptolyngbya sp. BC1307]|uniref:hypothetical protein n=1 Tax=Leptolyngbya sp. BC1307 TaxID=2029589 RepID=UPI0014838A8E|nr:hypothetical protein [Leptolyngbya sp. BC1307]
MPLSHLPRLLNRVREAVRLKHFGLSDVKTTLIYTHVLNRGEQEVCSLLDDAF